MRLLVVVAMMVVWAPGPARADRDRWLRGGVRVAVNGAAVDMPDDLNQGDLVESRVGVALGGFARVAVSSHLDVELGIAYSQRGYAVDVGDNFSGDPPGIDLDYVDAPLVFAGHFAAGETVRLRGLLGVTGSLVVNATRRQFGDSEDIRERVSSSDVALVFGAGLEWAIGNQRLVVELRQEIGMIDVVREDDFLATGPVKNRVLAVAVAAAF